MNLSLADFFYKQGLFTAMQGQKNTNYTCALNWRRQNVGKGCFLTNYFQLAEFGWF